MSVTYLADTATGMRDRAARQGDSSADDSRHDAGAQRQAWRGTQGEGATPESGISSRRPEVDRALLEVCL
jgi:hypothetical protein